MPLDDDLLVQFERERPRLLGIARGILSGGADAEDAVQEAWLRLAARDWEGIDNVSAWLTTVVTRLCLDQLRRRNVRREIAGQDELERVAAPLDVERELATAQSIGLALRLVLDALDPAERVAFVLHDVFGMPFADVAQTLGRSPAAARQLASRARRRLLAGRDAPLESMASQLAIANRYLAASRSGDLPALMALLDPEATLTIDLRGSREEVRGASDIAARALSFRRRAQQVRLALVDGVLAFVLTGEGGIEGALTLVIVSGRIASLAIITAPERLAAARIVLLEAPVG